MSEHNGGSMMAGVLLGAVIGAGLALMFAPMAGSDTRRHIGDAARKLGTGAKGRVDDLMGAIKGSAGDVGAAIDAGKEAFRHSAERTTAEREHA
jgi:gas vesicle protein